MNMLGHLVFFWSRHGEVTGCTFEASPLMKEPQPSFRKLWVYPPSHDAIVESAALWRTNHPVTRFQDGIEVFPPKRTNELLHVSHIFTAFNSATIPSWGPHPRYDRKPLWLHPSWNWSKTCSHKDVVFAVVFFATWFSSSTGHISTIHFFKWTMRCIKNACH